YKIVRPRPSSKLPSRSKNPIVVSRKRSCCSSRARFFLYFATSFPLASLRSRLRSLECMISETVTLAGRTKTCQEAAKPELNAPLRRTVNASETRMLFFRKHREQNAGCGCLNGSLSGKGQKLL